MQWNTAIDLIVPHRARRLRRIAANAAGVLPAIELDGNAVEDDTSHGQPCGQAMSFPLHRPLLQA